MKKTINPYAIIVSLTLVLSGILLILFDIFWLKTETKVFLNIGCSLIASGLVLFFTAILIDYRKSYIVWDEWKLEKIFKTRADKNQESDPKLEKNNIKQLDGIAFGLKSFRSNRRKDVLACMQKGMNVRLLVMDPSGPFVAQREREEEAVQGSISDSILSLVEWANKLNEESKKGKIEIRFYNTMTLDFYWRLDDEIYIGPYMLNMESQQTITYKFVKGGKGFQLYTDYFESLWNDQKFCKQIDKTSSQESATH